MDRGEKIGKIRKEENRFIVEKICRQGPSKELDLVSITSYSGSTKGGSLLNVAH